MRVQSPGEAMARLRVRYRGWGLGYKGVRIRHGGPGVRLRHGGARG